MNYIPDSMYMELSSYKLGGGSFAGHRIPASFDAIFTFATSVSKPSAPKYVELSRGTDHDEVPLTFRVTPELLEQLARERGPDLEYMLRGAHRPFHDPRKVYRIELSDPTLQISYSAGPIEIDRNKLH